MVGLLVMGVVCLSAFNQHASAQDVKEKAPPLDVAPSGNEPNATTEGLRLEQVKLRVRRARIGLLRLVTLVVRKARAGREILRTPLVATTGHTAS